jgi:predicted RNA-binding protein
MSEFNKKISSELACEDVIILEKQRFGRVRTTIMKQLRSEYGEEIANRILSRINKRASTGSSGMKESLNKSQLEFDFN